MNKPIKLTEIDLSDLKSPVEGTIKTGLEEDYIDYLKRENKKIARSPFDLFFGYIEMLELDKTTAALVDCWWNDYSYKKYRGIIHWLDYEGARCFKKKEYKQWMSDMDEIHTQTLKLDELTDKFLGNDMY